MNNFKEMLDEAGTLGGRVKRALGNKVVADLSSPSNRAKFKKALQEIFEDAREEYTEENNATTAAFFKELIDEIVEDRRKAAKGAKGAKKATSDDYTREINKKRPWSAISNFD